MCLSTFWFPDSKTGLPIYLKLIKVVGCHLGWVALEISAVDSIYISLILIEQRLFGVYNPTCFMVRLRNFQYL